MVYLYSNLEEMKTIRSLVIIILLVVPSILALTRPGFYGASDDMHVAWLHQLDKVVDEGQFPPRYVPDLSFGYGYPLFNFIFPLPYYLGEIFHRFGFSLVDSIKLVFGVGLIASGLTMYWLIKQFSDELTAIVGSVLYVYSPYRATDVYDRGALGESLAFVFLPLIVLFCVKISRTNRLSDSWRWIAAGGLSLGGLVLTHNIVAYMFAPFAFLLAMTISNRKNFLSMILMFVTGLVVSGYFWVPALIDSKLMKYETVFNYFDHFPTLRQLVSPGFGYGASVPGPYDGMSFFMGEANIVIILFSTILLFSRKSKFRKFVMWGLVLIYVSIFMMNYRSSWFWDNLPLIPYFQFPWRFLTLVTFASSFLVIVVEGVRYHKTILVGLALMTVFMSYGKFRPHDFLERFDDYYINRYIPIPNPSSEYLTLAEEYLRLPLNSTARPNEVMQRIYPQNNISDTRITTSLNASFVVQTDSDVVLNYNKYLFPGWVGFINGKRLELVAGKPYGQISFNVPAGRNSVQIYYKEPVRNMILDFLSVVTICFAVLISIFWRPNKILGR